MSENREPKGENFVALVDVVPKGKILLLHQNIATAELDGIKYNILLASSGLYVQSPTQIYAVKLESITRGVINHEKKNNLVKKNE